MMALGSSGELDCRGGNQCGAENRENDLVHRCSPRALYHARLRAPRISAAPQIAMAPADYYDRGHHEAASKFFDQKARETKYSAVGPGRAVLDLPNRSDRVGKAFPVRPTDEE